MVAQALGSVVAVVLVAFNTFAVALAEEAPSWPSSGSGWRGSLPPRRWVWVRRSMIKLSLASYWLADADAGQFPGLVIVIPVLQVTAGIVEQILGVPLRL